MENIKLKQPTVFLMCGPAGSGKSTWINNHYIWDYDSLISRDAIRFSLLKPGDNYFSKEYEVKRQFYSAIEEMTAPDAWPMHVFIDATHLNPKSRRLVLDRIGTTRKIIAVSLEAPLGVALERNAKREGLARVPDSVIRNMYYSFVVPTLQEGFDEVWHVDAEGVIRKEEI